MVSYMCCYQFRFRGNSQSKVKLFINGTQQTDLSTNNTMVDTHSLISTQNPHTIGKSSYANQDYADIYLAEVHFVGGSQLDPTSFTETKNGVLIPKEYTGSHGTNGFYLKFNQTGTGTASASTIGADSSGNSNHFTSSALASIDANRTDAPTNNFATFNTQWGGAGTYGTHGTIVNGGLELSSVGSATNAFCTQTLPSSGKYYVEMRVSSLNSFSGGVMQTAPSIHRSVLFQTDGTIDQDNSQVQSGLGVFQQEILLVCLLIWMQEQFSSKWKIQIMVQQLHLHLLTHKVSTHLCVVLMLTLSLEQIQRIWNFLFQTDTQHCLQQIIQNHPSAH